MVCALPVAVQKQMAEEFLEGARDLISDPYFHKKYKGTIEGMEDDESYILEERWHQRGLHNFSAAPREPGGREYTSALQRATRSDIKKSVLRVLKKKSKKQKA